MRVLMVVNKFPTLSETFVLNQIVGLIDRGVEVDILTHELDHRAEADARVERYDLLARSRVTPTFPEGPLRRCLHSISTVIQGLRRDYRATLHALDVRRRGFRVLNMRDLSALVPYLASPAYDVIHCQFGPLAATAAALRERGLLEAPFVVSFRGYDLTRWLNTNGTTAYASVFRQAARLLPVSHHFADRLSRIGAIRERIEVHHSGIDVKGLSFEPARTRSGVFRVIAVGRLVEKKGFRHAIQGLALLKSMDPGLNWSFTIVGEGPLREDLRRQIEDAGLEDSVQLIGRRSHEETLALIQQADALIAPSVRAPDGDEEGIPNVLKEAMAVGTPVVASSGHAGIGELVQHEWTGLAADPMNAAAVAEALRRLASEPNFKMDMLRRARELVESHFEVTHLNDRLVQIYQEVAGITTADP